MIAGLVTLVIPIYNVEKYLNRCIESVIQQTYKKIEIILIDDGSPDHCPQMCDEWSRKDSRIIVIHKENAGLGMARNTGIEAASGEYIGFFDSDDYLDNTLIEKAYKAAKETGAQSVVFGYKCIDASGNIIEEHIPTGYKSVFYTDEVKNLLLLEMIDPVPNGHKVSNISMSAWSKLYSMDLIRRTGWRFCSERQYSCEDLYSHLNWYANVSAAVLVSEALYNYCYNETSLTKTYRITAPHESEVCFEAMLDICKKNNYKAALVYRLRFWYFGSIIGICKSVMNSSMSKKEKLNEYRKILYSEHFNKVMRETDFSNEAITRRILHFVIKNKMYRSLYWMMFIQENMTVKCLTKKRTVS